MNKTAPEPGFIQAYRLFVVIRILFWLVIGPALILFQMAGNPILSAERPASETLIRQMTLPNVSPLISLEAVLLALLFLPLAPQRLGRAFVPLTLVLGLVPLLVGYYWWPAANPLQSPFAMFFFVTTVLIAWEYRYRLMAVFVFCLTLYELLVSSWPQDVPAIVPISWMALQTVTMLLAGFVTATLVSVQREQRSALAHAYQQQAAANRRLQQHAATLEELTISRERNRMARELHDTLAHSLSALTVQLEAVRTLWDTQPEKARRILDEADRTSRTGLGEARRALQALRASPLQDLGLVLAVRELAETAAQRSGATLDMRLPDRLTADPSPSCEQGIYRIAQETLENIVDHACARSILVELQQAGDGVTLVIADDGLGIDPANLAAPTDTRSERFGIRGMREWAHLMGGQLEIDGEAGHGTRVTLTVPLGRPTDGSSPDL